MKFVIPLSVDTIVCSFLSVCQFGNALDVFTRIEGLLLSLSFLDQCGLILYISRGFRLLVVR